MRVSPAALTGLLHSAIRSFPKTPIEITVIKVKGDQVRMGIMVPRSVSVDRAEVYEAKQKEAAWIGGGAEE